MLEEYYKPGEITFRKSQILWLIRHLYLIRIGEWPPEHKETGYIGNPKRGINKQAKFTRPCEIAGETEARLESCGIDGLLLEFSIIADYDDQIAVEHKLANYLRITDEDINFRIQTALGYCSGNCRKSMSCDKCLSLPRCMQKPNFRKKQGNSYHRYYIEHKSYMKRRGLTPP